MGLLLLQNKRNTKVTANPVMTGLNIVYTPSSESGSGDDDGSSNNLVVRDPSGVPISFQSANDFTKLEKITR